jgi:hypothetical protein
MKLLSGDCFPSAVFFHGRQNTKHERRRRREEEEEAVGNFSSCSHCFCLLVDD